jgi:hypothetical protein
VRNPWNIDTFEGAWSDGSSQWTAAYKAQVPYVNNQYDGSFFIQDTDFPTAFYYFQINNVHDDWTHSYYEVVTDTTSAQRSFTFTIKNTQEMFVQADFYDYRMYPTGCKPYYTQGSLALYSGSTQL